MKLLTKRNCCTPCGTMDTGVSKKLLLTKNSLKRAKIAKWLVVVSKVSIYYRLFACTKKRECRYNSILVHLRLHISLRKCYMIPLIGVEPILPQRELDFESSASANSATAA